MAVLQGTQKSAFNFQFKFTQDCWILGIYLKFPFPLTIYISPLKSYPFSNVPIKRHYIAPQALAKASKTSLKYVFHYSYHFNIPFFTPHPILIHCS